MELKYAIYNGLEMKLKVTQMLLVSKINILQGK